MKLLIVHFARTDEVVNVIIFQENHDNPGKDIEAEKEPLLLFVRCLSCHSFGVSALRCMISVERMYFVELSSTKEQRVFYLLLML
jgi:hypothetical protein